MNSHVVSVMHDLSSLSKRLSGRELGSERNKGTLVATLMVRTSELVLRSEIFSSTKHIPRNILLFIHEFYTPSIAITSE